MAALPMAAEMSLTRTSMRQICLAPSRVEPPSPVLGTKRTTLWRDAVGRRRARTHARMNAATISRKASELWYRRR